MPARSKDTRKEILAKLYHFCKFNLDPNGFWNGEKLPNYEANISWEMREAVASMNIDEWVEEANKTIEAYNMTRKTEKKPTDPLDYPMAPLPQQTNIDFDKSDWQSAIVRIADAITERQDCKSEHNVYRWLRNLLDEFGVYKKNEELLESRESCICWYAAQIAGNAPCPL